MIRLIKFTTVVNEFVVHFVFPYRSNIVIYYESIFADSDRLNIRNDHYECTMLLTSKKKYLYDSQFGFDLAND